MQQYLSDSQLAERYDVSRATVWRWVTRGILPRPVRFSRGCTRWKKEEVDQRDAEIAKQSAA